MFVVASTWKLLFCSQNFLCGGKAIQNTQDFYVKINSFCISFRDNNVSICNLFSCHVDNRTAATCSRCHYTGTRPGKWGNRSRRIWPIILLLQVCSRNFILQSFHLTGILWTLLLQGLDLLNLKTPKLLGGGPIGKKYWFQRVQSQYIYLHNI